MKPIRVFLLVVLSCVCAFALSACGAGVPATATPTLAPSSTQTPPIVVTPTAQASPTTGADAGINVTRKDYDEALAKWRAADVREYEIVASYMFTFAEISGDWRLRVRDGAIVEIWRGDVRLFLDNENGLLNPEANPSNLAFLTVEEQFETIRKVLDDPANRGLVLGGERYEVEYQIAFNDALGYPERYAIYPRTVTDNERITQIKTLRVIEQGPNATVVVTPGTQITLQPGPDVILDATYDPAAKQALEEALTKWQAAAITEYEFTTRYMDEGTEQQWTLRVSGDKVTLVASTEGTDAQPNEYAIGLPEVQFATLNDAANNIENLTEDGKLVMTYAVRFDTNYGFPVRFEMRPEPGPAPDLGYVIIVDDFRVIATK